MQWYIAVWMACVVAALPVRRGHATEGPVPSRHFAEWFDSRDRSEDGLLHQFRLINYFFVRGIASNTRSDPIGTRGLSLGPIGRPTTPVGDGEAFLAEQRWIPILSATPFFTDGWGEFRAMFEIDATWAFAANGVQPNQGAGFGSRQVNIQTKDVYAAIFPTQDPSELSILIGTQPLFDSIYNPHTTPPFELINSGYKLSVLGGDATGIAAYGELFGVLGKLAFVPLTVSQPNKAENGDPGFAFAYLTTLDAGLFVQPGTFLGLTYWYLRDDTEGLGFAVEGLVRSGPSSLGLAALNGHGAMNISRPRGYVHYLGFNFHHNLRFHTGPLSASGFVLVNSGRFKARDDRSPNPNVRILGVAANLEANYNYGKTPDDTLSLELMGTNGDDDPTDDIQRGPFTLNNYGLASATWVDTKTLILFPFSSTATNYNGAVNDIHNQGYGVVAIIGSASHDFIPYKLNLKLGIATGMSFAKPKHFAAEESSDASSGKRGRMIGTELNVEMKYHIRYAMTVGVHAAVLLKGDFYHESPYVVATPWAAFTTFTWVLF
ncbi:MAG: hypothetical protein IPK13_09465 [Deltaproteobacteria bacterium]|nr:hypothetical protein [Deltaproteobacteria bacterium]